METENTNEHEQEYFTLVKETIEDLLLGESINEPMTLDQTNLSKELMKAYFMAYDPKPGEQKPECPPIDEVKREELENTMRLMLRTMSEMLGIEIKMRKPDFKTVIDSETRFTCANNKCKHIKYIHKDKYAPTLCCPKCNGENWLKHETKHIITIDSWNLTGKCEKRTGIDKPTATIYSKIDEEKTKVWEGTFNILSETSKDNIKGNDYLGFMELTTTKQKETLRDKLKILPNNTQGMDLLGFSALYTRQDRDLMINELYRAAKNAVSFKKLPNWNIEIKDYRALAESFIDRQPALLDENSMLWLFKNNTWFMLNKDKSTKRTVKTDCKILLRNSPASQRLMTIRDGNEFYDQFEGVAHERFRELKPFKRSWVQFGNTILDLNNGKVLPLTPNYFSRNKLPHDIGANFKPNYDWREAVKLCPHFKEFMETRVIPIPTINEYKTAKMELERDPKNEAAKTRYATALADYDEYDKGALTDLYEMLGYFATRGQKYQKAHFIHGGTDDTKNGKTHFTEVLIRPLFGNENIATTKWDEWIETRFNINFYNKLIGVFDDMRPTLTDDEMLRSMTGGAPAQFEQKFKDAFNAEFTAKPLMSANTIPRIVSGEPATIRRFRYILFPNTYAEGEKSPLAYATKTEFTRFIKIVAGQAVKVWNDGFTNLYDIEHNRKFVEDRADPLARYLEETIIKDENENEGEQSDSKLIISDLITSKKPGFYWWCKKHRTPRKFWNAPTNKSMAMRLGRIFKQLTQDANSLLFAEGEAVIRSKGKHGKGVYHGYRIKTPLDLDAENTEKQKTLSSCAEPTKTKDKQPKKTTAEQLEETENKPKW